MISNVTFSNFSVGVITLSVVGIAMGIAWLCAKVTNIEQVITTPFVENTAIKEALSDLKADHVKASELAEESVRIDKLTSDQVNVATELGHQSAAEARHVAKGLASSIHRADSETSGEPGAAADAGLRSNPEEETT